MTNRFLLSQSDLLGLLGLFAIAYKDGAFVDGRTQKIAEHTLPLAGGLFSFKDAVTQVMRAAPAAARFEAGLWALEEMGILTLRHEDDLDRGGNETPLSNPFFQEQHDIPHEGDRWAATLLGMQVAWSHVKERWAFEKPAHQISDASKETLNQALVRLGPGMAIH